MSSLPTIVIPYFKLPYLDAALASLAAQTLGGFKVFIGDDASPEDPRSVLEKYKSRLEIKYHRFENNLGKSALTKHWDRCVQKTSSEWVWLFSDDDVAAPGCLAAFARTLDQTMGSYDVYRFNTRMIDGGGNVIQGHPAHPGVENVADFALAKLLSQRFSFAVEYIFRREAYDKAGGFVEFPLAWFSDDASWISFARNGKIFTMDSGEVSWRKSGVNLSSPKPELARAKFAGLRIYLQWLQKRFPEPGFQQRMKTELSRCFPDLVQHWGGNPDLVTCLDFWFFFARFTGNPNSKLLRTFLGLTGLKQKILKPQAVNQSNPAVPRR